MELTKYEHACFVVEKNGKSIVVDPGSFTSDLIIPSNVVAVIITHEHGDHLDMDHLVAIVKINPDMVIIGPQEVTAQLGSFQTRTVHGGDSFAIGGINLDFYGNEHEPIHTDFPKSQNVGVLIDDRLYYPGDSFTVPGKSVDTLALPVAAPWLKLQDAIEFMKVISARFTFPTHDAILSSSGKAVADSMLSGFAEAASTDYRRIDGDTIKIEINPDAITV